MSIADFCCRPHAQALADSLSSFSLDVVDLCASYVVRPVATKDAKPTLLFTITPKQQGLSLSVAVSPETGNIWLASTNKLQVFSNDGDFLFAADRIQGGLPGGIVTHRSGDVFIAHYQAQCIKVCNPEGVEQRRFGGRNYIG